MQKKRITAKAAAQAVVTAAAGVAGILIGISQYTGIGQTYQCVSANGVLIGYVSEDTDVKAIMQAARRELAQESEERLCMDYTWDVTTSRTLFRKLLSEDELKQEWKEILQDSVIHSKERVYTVAIDGYRANFSTLADVTDFLDKVKASADEAGEYKTEIHCGDSHIGGILTAELTRTEPKETKTAVPEQFSSDQAVAGVSEAIACAMEYALTDLPEEGYQTGILDMAFVEKVEVYENYVGGGEISDVNEQVIEVTKEKESNKIYVVESGDCLSVIAMDHDTTVSSIMSLNGLENANTIREGQELIIAVPEPDLMIRVTMGEVYEEDYTAEPIIIENDSWYTTKEVVHEEGAAGHRERNDVVVYENGIEIKREMVCQNVMVESVPAVIERGTIVPPTYIKPISGGRYTSGFGRRWGRMHKGVDWACPTGTTVYASSAGTVIQASYNGGYGYNVVISHPDGRMTRYAHNSKLLVHAGQWVEQGEPIAKSGSTGRSTGPHVHFEIYINGAPVNPLKYIGN